MDGVGDGAAGQPDLWLPALGLHPRQLLEQPGRDVRRHGARVVVPDDLGGHFFAGFRSDFFADFFAALRAAGRAIPLATSFFAVAA